MERQGAERRQRLVLVPFPAQGHITPMLQLATILHSKGFSITIVHSQFNSPDPSTHPEFLFQSLQDNKSTLSPNFVSDLQFINTNCTEPFQELLTNTMYQKDSPERVVGVIHDNLMYFPVAIANNLKLPSIVFRTSGAAFLRVILAVPRLNAQGYIPLQVVDYVLVCRNNHSITDSMLQEPVPGVYPLRFKDLPVSDLTLEDTLKFVEITGSIRTSTAIIWNTTDYLEQAELTELQQHYQVPVFPIGPLPKMAQIQSTSLLKEDDSCISWLNKQAHNSVIYASLGSTATMEEKELIETAWGLANSNQPFLWVVRPGSVHGSKWMELLPESFIEEVAERSCIVGWAPQREVLAHSAVGGFWSHCGWNSTLESICEGVPMMCKPCFGDQKVISRYVTYVWKVGLELGNTLERREIERAIKTILVDKEGKEMRRRASEMKEKVRACVCEGGSSNNSLNDLVEYLSS